MKNSFLVASKPVVLAGAVITTTLLTGCNNSNTTYPTMVGQVVGSYIENARVCMDTNKNGQCDAGESDYSRKL